MAIICIILLIFLLPLLIFGLKDATLKDIEDRKKNPWRYQPRPKRHRRSEKWPSLPWIWWYTHKD